MTHKRSPAPKLMLPSTPQGTPLKTVAVLKPWKTPHSSERPRGPWGSASARLSCSGLGLFLPSAGDGTQGHTRALLSGSRLHFCLDRPSHLPNTAVIDSTPPRMRGLPQIDARSLPTASTESLSPPLIVCCLDPFSVALIKYPRPSNFIKKRRLLGSPCWRPGSLSVG